MANYKPHLDLLFADAEHIMWKLSESTGAFTFHAFLRKAAQNNQVAYLGLLNEVVNTRPQDTNYLFNLAHQEIGSRLSTVAAKLGYDIERDVAIAEQNIWGDPVKRGSVYQRTERVKPV